MPIIKEKDTIKKISGWKKNFNKWWKLDLPI